MLLAMSLAPVLIGAGPASAAPNLVVNGSFEEPDIATNSFVVLPSIPGWTEPGACDIELHDRLFGPAADGNQWVELDSRCSTLIYQDIPTTPGQTYTITYAFSPRPGIADNTIVVSWDGTDVDTHNASGVGLPSTSWTVYGVTVTATGTTTRLAFRATDPSNAAGTFLDAVQVTAVTPCTAPTSFLVHNGQLFSGTMNNGVPINFTPVGAAVPGGYNALAYNYADGYLYAVQGGQVIRIDPSTGAVIPLGNTTPPLGGGEIVGAFDAAGNYVTISGQTLQKVNVATMTLTTVPLSSDPGLADITLGPGGFLWGARPDGIVRIDPTNGAVTTFPLPPGMAGATGMGGAFTFPNGDIGFVQNNPLVIYRVRVSDAASATPTFTLISNQSLGLGPAAQLDAAACVQPANAICLSPPPASLPGYNTIIVQPGQDTKGTEGNDLIIGSSSGDRIAALGGNDIIFGMGGDDRISAGTGDDIICAGPGDDWLAGEDGNDVLSGDEGNDDMSGGFRDDQLFGGPGADRFSGDAATDICYLGGGEEGDIAAVPSCEMVV